MRTRRSSEREPADLLRDKYNLIGGCLPSVSSVIGLNRMSPVTKWRLTAIFGWMIAVGLLGLEGLRLAEFRTGGGSAIDSPDGTSTAWLDSYRKGGPLVRDTNVWIDVCIQPKGSSGVADTRYLRFSCPDRDIQDEMYARNHDGAISWSSDSRMVRVVLPGKEIAISR